MVTFWALSLLPLLSSFSGTAFAAPLDVNKRASPTLTLDNGTFVGKVDGSTNKFLGIPFAKPPYVRHPVQASLRAPV